MNSPPVTKKRGGDLAATTPNCFDPVDLTPVVCGSQTSWCEHGNTRIEQLANGPHYAREVCTDCDRVLRWLPKPVNLKRQQLNAFRLAKLAMCNRLSAWERQFVSDVGRLRRLSPRQGEIVDRLARQYLGERGS